MADEDLSAVQTGLETPATELPQQAVEEPTAPETETVETEQVEGVEGEGVTAEDFEDIEIDGETYQVPKALKGAFMKNADYTQKTQAVSAREKALEARETEVEERLKVTDEELDQRASLKGITATLEQYGKVDWDAYEAQDPAGAQQHWRKYQQLKEQAGELKTALDHKATQRTASAQQDLAKRVQETLSYVADPKNGFKADSIETLTKFALNEGISEAQITKNWSPGFVNLLRKAHVGHLAMTKPLTPAPKPAPAPLKVVSAKSNPTNRKTPGEMTMAETAAAFRKEQEAKRA